MTHRAQEWFDEYSESHRKQINKLLHWICLPVIVLTWLVYLLDQLAVPLWVSCVTLFVVAWIGQFTGHAVEGKRPSFFKDVQFLMIGPLWLLAHVYKRAGIPL